jgi:lipoprotein NlpD
MPFCEFDRGEWMEGIKKILTAIFSILLVLSFVLACSAPSSYVQKEPAKGIYHRVKKGETFWSIARAYHIKIQDLAEVNNISNPGLLEEGSVLFVPDTNQAIDDVITAVKKMDAQDKAVAGADSTVRLKSPPENSTEENVVSAAEDNNGPGKKALPLVVTPEKVKVAKLTPREDVLATESAPARKPADEKIEHKSKSKSAEGEKDDIQFEKKRFIWPVEERTVKTRFGIQPNKTYHNWIKIVSAAGTPVKAADDGMVIFSAPLKNYGKTIIVRHKNSYATVYTHLKKISVKTDKKIKKGDVIALIGETDEAGDTYMNFEVRLHGKARNPLFFLP